MAAGRARRRRLLALGFMVLCLYPAARYGAMTWRNFPASLTAPNGTLVVRDFVDFWGAARAVREGHAALPFHPAAFHRWLHARFAPAWDVNTWSYPPSFLLLLLPLGFLGLLPAFGLWLAGTLTLLFGVLRRLGIGAVPALAVLASPAAAETLLDGQNGALTASLLAGGFGLLERSPVAAGALFGVLTIKPQLGLLVPVALLAARQYRAVAAAAVTAAALAGLSALVLGAGSWSGFFAATRPYMTHLLVLSGHRQLYQLMMPTPFMAARVSGAGIALAAGLQAVVTALAAGTMWWLWSRPAPPALRLALSLTLVLLATPFAYDYDMIPVAIAAMLLACEGIRDRFLPGEGAVLAAWLLPGIVVSLGFLGVSVAGPVIVAWLAIVLVRRIRRSV